MPVYGGSSSAPKRKQSNSHWYSPSTIGHNFLEDIKALRGIPAGLKLTGQAIAHDVQKPFGASSGQYLLDNIIGGAVKQIEHNWSPLVHGDFKQFAKNFAAHPLDMGLDVASLATGGAAAAGKAANVAKVAGSTGKIAGKLSKYELASPELAASLAEKAIIPGAKAGRGAVSGQFFVPKQYALRDVGGNVTANVPLAANPLVRARQVAREKALAAGVLGSRYQPAARGARITAKQVDRIANRTRLQLKNSAAVALGRLKKNEQQAVFLAAQGFDNAAAIDALLKFRANTVSEMAAKKVSEMPVEDRNLLPSADSNLSEVADPSTPKQLFEASRIANDVTQINKLRSLLENPTTRMREAIDALAAVEQHTTDTLIKMGRLTAKEAVDRRSLPLRLVGITPAENQRLVTITHIAPSRSRKDKRARSRGLTIPVLDEAKKNRGVNFATANYSFDPKSVLDSFDRVTGAHRIAMRLEYAMSLARPATKADIGNEDLHLIKKGGQDSVLLRDIQSFLDEELKPNLGDMNDEQYAAVKGAIDSAVSKLENSDMGLVMDKNVYAELTREVRGAKGLIAKLASSAIGQWRQIVLNLKGTFYVNNFLGNLMLGLVTHPARFVPALVAETSRVGKKSADIRAAVPDIPRHAAGIALNKQASRLARIKGLEVLGDKVAKFMAHVTDDNFRRAAFRIEANKLVKEHAKRSGISKGDAWEQILNDAQAVDHIAQKMYGDLLDYSRMTESERLMLVPFYPFWSFTRSMAGRTIQLAGDEPWKMQALLIWGDYGIQQTEKQVGPLPDFLRGLILLDSSKTQPLALPTYGMNPFTAPVDTASQLSQLLGVTSSSEPGATNPVTSMNPLVKAGIETLTGRDAFYGTPVESNVKGFAGQLARSAPQYVIYHNLVLPSKSPSLQRTPEQMLQGYFGYPVGQLNMENVRRNEAISAMYRRKDVQAAIKRKMQEEARRRSLSEALNG
jgi:hypothetical protein